MTNIPVPDSIRSLVGPDEFNPTYSFPDFALLMKCVLSEGFDFNGVLSQIYSGQHLLSDMTVHQIVSAVYAAASKDYLKLEI